MRELTRRLGVSQNGLGQNQRVGAIGLNDGQYTARAQNAHRFSVSCLRGT